MKAGAAVVAVAAAVALGWVGFARGTYAAGGSDSSCYALLAASFASGALQPSSVLARQVPWPDASRTFTPGGFVPSRSDPAASAPVCTPGFSLLLAPVVRVGGPDGLFGVTPVAGALLVWLAFLAGRALSGSAAGVMSAALVASSPTVLYQVVQPMNDVATAALWMAAFVALVSRRWALAGSACGLALLVRPNLAPLAIVSGIFVLLASRFPLPDFRPRLPNPVLRIPFLVFAVCALPFVLAALGLNAALYGSPFKSGYGQLDNLFGASAVPVNVVRYTRWLIEAQTPFPLMGLAAPFLLERRSRPAALLALGLIAATAAVYFAYTPFDDWSYLRFLMPAIALLLVLASASAVAVLSALVSNRWARAACAAALTVGLSLFCIRAAEDRLAFRVYALEQRFRSVGFAVREKLPPEAVMLATWDSGAIRFHAGREVVVWDALDPEWLDRALEWLARHGRPPYIVTESWEEPGFRARFAGDSDFGKLDWPPKYEVDRVVRIYDPADRARYLRGEKVTTEYLWPLGVTKN